MTWYKADSILQLQASYICKQSRSQVPQHMNNQTTMQIICDAIMCKNMIAVGLSIIFWHFQVSVELKLSPFTNQINFIGLYTCTVALLFPSQGLTLVANITWVKRTQDDSINHTVQHQIYSQGTVDIPVCAAVSLDYIRIFCWRIFSQS